MYDKQNEIYERHVMQVFGPDAVLTGVMGSETAAGDVRIQINGRTVGTGMTFQEALQTAQRALSVLAVAG